MFFFQYKRKPVNPPISKSPDLDRSALPDWLKEELNNSEEAWIEQLSPEAAGQ